MFKPSWIDEVLFASSACWPHWFLEADSLKPIFAFKKQWEIVLKIQLTVKDDNNKEDWSIDD